MNKTKKITILSLFVAIGLILQYIEDRFAISSIPGGKLGLCNIVSIINIFMFSGVNALAIAMVRSLLGSMLFGSAMAIPYSMAGAVFSTLFMWGAKKYYPKVSCIGISVIGAVAHNISQIILASVFYGTIYVFSYLPVLLITALCSGFATGYVAYIFVKRLLKGEISV